jgi:pimeloyl-ACP methyl ester carboxylesterase
MGAVQVPLATAKARVERPLALDALLERYDPDVIDLLGRRARIRLEASEGAWDAVLEGEDSRLERARGEPSALISADDETWRRMALDPRGGLVAFRERRLRLRRNLHLGIGFLAATSAVNGPGRLRFDSHRTAAGRIAVAEAGTGDPVLCVHGLGGTKASFMTTLAALAPRRRVIALDLPGFGDSDKPLTGRYDAPWFAGAIVALLDELGIERADVIGNSMGGRAAIELGLLHPDRTRRLVLLSPAMAWLRHDRTLKWLLQLPLPRLGLLQPTPRALVEPIVHRLVPGGTSGWVSAGVDEFLRTYCTAAGRYAFYEAARNIYRDQPHGEDGFWHRLAGLSPETMFVWGRRDTLVPIAFMKHVERELPAARHVELDCGHVPQVEAPGPTHAAIAEFLEGGDQPI